MKILFDSQIFDWQLNGGISRYFIEVINRLARDEQTDILFSVNHSYNTYIQGTRWLKNKAILKNISFKGKLGALKLINQGINRPYSNSLLKKGNADIFHPTYYDPYFLKKIGSTPFVLTVYDLTNEKFNDGNAQTIKVMGWKRALIGQANHIIAISENTRKDIIDFYKVEPAKVTTIHLSGGFDENLLNSANKNDITSIPEKYVLFVGSRSSYKNFIPFVKEIAPLLKQEGMHLVTAGGSNLQASELQTIKELGIADQIVSFPHVSDQFLVRLYSRAIVFVFPSLYEGFGLPVLEAMQCKCPALLSNNSSLPEVGGDAAAYFDPFTQGSLQHSLLELIKDDGRRLKMKRDGLEQCKLFDWDKTAAAHKEVYKKIVG